MQILRNTSNRQASVAMGDYGGDEYVSVGAVPLPRVDKFKKVSVLPLVFLIFYEVSRGGHLGLRILWTLLVLF